MLLSPAYAAESGASDSTADAAVATAAEAQSVKLVFASDKTLTGANGDTVKEIFKSRLLAHEQFVQCSVSSVVNLRYVRCLEKNCLYLLDGRQISISRQAGAGVRSKWQKYWSSPSETHVEF